MDRYAVAVLNMLWKIMPEGAAKAVWWEVKEARKRLKKGIVPREAVGWANPVVPRLVAHAVRPRSYVYLSVFNLEFIFLRRGARRCEVAQCYKEEKKIETWKQRQKS